LIVQCNQCEAKYRIADEKISGLGVRVRCAKCDNVFTVKPEAAPAEETPAAVETALVGPANGDNETQPDPPAPPPPEDPAPEQRQVSEDPASEEEPEPQPEPESGSEDPVPEEEPEQQFSEGLGDLGSFSGPGGTPGMDSTPPEEEKDPLPELTDGDQALGRPEGEFIKQDDGPAESYQAPVQLTDESPTNGPGMDWGNIALDSPQDEDRTDTNMDLTPPSPLGTPEPDTAPSLDAGLAPPDPFHEESALPPRETTTASRAAAPSPPAKKGGKGMIFLLVIALLAGGGYFIYPKALQLMKSGNPADEGTLLVQEIVVGTVKQKGGILLAVVRGKIRNDSSSSKGMIQVQGTFKGPDGRALAESVSFCGNTFTDGELAASSLETIRSALANELGQSLSNSSLRPGETVPFLIVLENPPNQIKEVTVTVKNWSSTT